LRGVDAARQQRLQLVKTCLGRLARDEARGMPKLLDHRPERAVAMIG
jgi:hypothetical protein